jgi:ribosomal protein S1/(E)-4-hydroxy-3-methyl-but-2-enyl pyrophosphate reductase
LKILLANNAGFCFGVKQAIDKAVNSIVQNRDSNIFTYGPLIHNHQVIKSLEQKGIRAIEHLEDAKGNTIIVRSHGVPLEFYEKAKNLNISIIDATCPFVRKVQNIARKYYKKGYCIAIVGNSNHPEVIGINGWCNNKAYVIEKESDLERLEYCEKICAVAQTTITLDLWNTIIQKLKQSKVILKEFNTICTATSERQESCAKIAKKADAMIIIGGYHSSNTQKLFQISQKYCKETYHIETAEELPIECINELNKIGVTAGASTPDWIIKEVIHKMSNNDQQKNANEMMNMMEEIENSFTVPRKGNILKGKVIHVTDDEIMVNVGGKSDGIIPKEEISNDPLVNPKEIVQEGDEIEVYVLKTDDGEGNILLSKKKIDAEKDWNYLEKISDTSANEIIEVKVIEVVKGGVIAMYKDIKGFIPASQLSDTYVEDLRKFVEQLLEVKVINFNKSKRKVIFSRRAILEEEKEKKRQLLWETIEKGKLVEGEVKRITDFGAFVDIGGVDGLIHISDLSWGRVKHPTEVVNVDDKVEVIILDFDKERNRISLGLKQTTPEPWESVEEKYHVGEIIDGKVVNLVDFGAFVELEPGVDGLVHISQIANRHIAKPSEELEIGQTVEVKILDVDKEARRISLSIKEATEQFSEVNEEPENQIQETDEEKLFTIGDMLDSKETEE